MSDTRIVVEVPCEHGEAADCDRWASYRPEERANARVCKGGSRRILTEGQYVLVEDLHDLLPDAWRVLNAAAAFGHPGGSAALWRDLRAALRGDMISDLPEDPK